MTALFGLWYENAKKDNFCKNQVHSISNFLESRMGKASRRKQERSGITGGMSTSFEYVNINSMRALPPEPELMPEKPKQGSKVFRFCQTLEQADQLASGKIWLGTLSNYRAAENADRGDVGEGTDQYSSGHHQKVSGDEAMLLARRMGIFTGPILNAYISGNRVSRKIPDAYAVCTTLGFEKESLSDSFGKYCVKISDPGIFFECIDKELRKIYNVQGSWGMVRYKERAYAGFDDSPGVIGFVKPPDQYQEQQEVRFLWIPKASVEIQPFLLNVPACSEICERIS